MRGFINIIIGIIIVIAGSSGKFVLKGTNSSGMLIGVGIIIIIFGIVRIVIDHKGENFINELEGSENKLLTENQKIRKLCYNF